MVSTTEVCSSMETSEVYTVKAPNSGDANSRHLRIADTFSVGFLNRLTITISNLLLHLFRYNLCIHQLFSIICPYNTPSCTTNIYLNKRGLLSRTNLVFLEITNLVVQTQGKTRKENIRFTSLLYVLCLSSFFIIVSSQVQNSSQRG